MFDWERTIQNSYAAVTFRFFESKSVTSIVKSFCFGNNRTRRPSPNTRSEIFTRQLETPAGAGVSAKLFSGRRGDHFRVDHYKVAIFGDPSTINGRGNRGARLEIVSSSSDQGWFVFLHRTNSSTHPCVHSATKGLFQNRIPWVAWASGRRAWFVAFKNWVSQTPPIRCEHDLHRTKDSKQWQKNMLACGTLWQSTRSNPWALQVTLCQPGRKASICVRNILDAWHIRSRVHTRSVLLHLVPPNLTKMRCTEQTRRQEPHRQDTIVNFHCSDHPLGWWPSGPFDQMVCWGEREREREEEEDHSKLCALVAFCGHHHHYWRPHSLTLPVDNTGRPFDHNLAVPVNFKLCGTQHRPGSDCTKWKDVLFGNLTVVHKKKKEKKRAQLGRLLFWNNYQNSALRDLPWPGVCIGFRWHIERQKIHAPHWFLFGTRGTICVSALLSHEKWLPWRFQSFVQQWWYNVSISIRIYADSFYVELFRTIHTSAIESVLRTHYNLHQPFFNSFLFQEKESDFTRFVPNQSQTRKSYLQVLCEHLSERNSSTNERKKVPRALLCMEVTEFGHNATTQQLCFLWSETKWKWDSVGKTRFTSNTRTWFWPLLSRGRTFIWRVFGVLAFQNQPKVLHISTSSCGWVNWKMTAAVIRLK